MGAPIDAADLRAMLEALEDQERAGHTAETDLDHSCPHLAERVHQHALLVRDVTYPGERLNLNCAYSRAARTAALSVALMRRIRLEKAKGAPTNV